MNELLIPILVFVVWTAFSVTFILRHKRYQTNETADKTSFWNNTYHEVKKELQRRYPKHAWPDDPWSATAVAKGRSTKF